MTGSTVSAGVNSTRTERQWGDEVGRRGKNVGRGKGDGRNGRRKGWGVREGKEGKEDKEGLAGVKAKPEVVRLAAGEAQKGASREVQAAMRARFSCS